MPSAELDLQDDYRDAQGRTSVDAAALFGGVLSMAVIASEVLDDTDIHPGLARVLTRLDIRRALPGPAASPTAPHA